MPVHLLAAIDYVHAIKASGPVGIGVLAILLLASGWSWTIIFQKSLQLRRAQARSLEFLETFWQAKRLDEIYSRSNSMKDAPVAQVFRAGYVELAKLTGEGGERKVDPAGIDNIERALRRAANAELTHLESRTSFLGSTAAAAPFVGLFGTVWGIMNSFIGISKAQTTNLAVVAPGIAEALLATAIGLVAAIPAVIIYNAFTRSIGGYKALLADASSEVMRLLSRDLDRRDLAARERRANLRPVPNLPMAAE